MCVVCFNSVFCVFCVFFKQKTAYEMRISDWSSDVCSSDLHGSLRFLAHRLYSWQIRARWYILWEYFTPGMGKRPELRSRSSVLWEILQKYQFSAHFSFEAT